jgi:hypothetical protein
MTLAPHDHSMPAGSKLTFPLQSFVVMASHPLMSASGHTSRHYSIVFIGWEAKSVEGQAGNFQDRTARLEEQADFPPRFVFKKETVAQVDGTCKFSNLT